MKRTRRKKFCLKKLKYQQGKILPRKENSINRTKFYYEKKIPLTKKIYTNNKKEKSTNRRKF